MQTYILSSKKPYWVTTKVDGKEWAAKEIWANTQEEAITVETRAMGWTDSPIEVTAVLA